MALLSAGCSAACPHTEATGKGVPPQHRVGTPSEIVAASLHAYAHCRSYRDAGTIVMTRSQDATRRSSTGRFATLFARGRGFRFEYEAVRGDAAADVALFSIEGLTLETSPGRAPQKVDLNEAVGRLAGTTFGVSALVPEMLLRPSRPNMYLHGGCRERRADRIVGTDDCFQLACSHPNGRERSLIFVRKRDLAVRAVEFEVRLPRVATGEGPDGTGPTPHTQPGMEATLLRQTLTIDSEFDGTVDDIELSPPASATDAESGPEAGAASGT